MTVYKQFNGGKIDRFREGYFLYSWNECIKENFKEKNVDLGTNDDGPHAEVDLGQNDRTIVELNNKYIDETIAIFERNYANTNKLLEKSEK